ncbi:hypothetical protein VTI28DRAFT_4388 [Corynascus sepedonium]
MSALQRVIAYSSAQRLLERQMEEKAPRKAIADGTFKDPEIRIPVIIIPDGPVSSAKALQQLAEMGSVPKTLDATLIRDHWVSTERPVTICYIDDEESEIIEGKANIEYDPSGKFMVRVEEQNKYAMVVLSLKEGVMLPNSSEVSIMEKVEEPK